LTRTKNIISWDDYWNVFRDLCTSLSNKSKTEVVRQLKDARGYVNGLSDGWHEFLNRFKQVCSKYREQIEADDTATCNLLIQTLTESLERR